MFNKFKNVKPKKMKITRFEDAPLAVKLVTAGVAGCTADMFTFPLDTAKVRLQIQGEGSAVSAASAKAVLHYKGVLHTIATIAREEGAKSLYNGLTAGLQRQMCFSSVRIGLYETVKNFYQSFGKDNEPSGAFDLITRISAGVTTGALSVIVAQPTDVVKVRFQAQQGKGERYKSTTEAYKTIFKVEGVRGLWKGFCPNIVRNAVVNVSEIVCYDLVKDAILRKNLLPDNTMCHFISAVIAGFCATVVSSPVDVIKTRYMNSPPGKYKSAVHCAVETARMEGPLAFYKGFTPSFTRLVAWNIVLWVSYEKLKVFVTKILSEKS